MTTLENRPNAALLVVDVQNGVVMGTTSATLWWRISSALFRKHDGNRSGRVGPRLWRDACHR